MRLPLLTHYLLTVGIASAPGLAQSANSDAAKPPSAREQAVPEPPPPPQNYNPPEAPEAREPEFEPDVSITTKGTEIHEEYRVNGRLYMIKVTPAQGKPYYLIDDVGDANFRRSDIQPQFSVPMWVIKSF